MDSWKSNGISEENIENITKLDSNFASNFIDHNALANIKFNGHCLINNTFIPKKCNKSIYFLHTKFMVTKFKLRFYIK